MFLSQGRHRLFSQNQKKKRKEIFDDQENYFLRLPAQQLRSGTGRAGRSPLPRYSGAGMEMMEVVWGLDGVQNPLVSWSPRRGRCWREGWDAVLALAHPTLSRSRSDGKSRGCLGGALGVDTHHTPPITRVVGRREPAWRWESLGVTGMLPGCSQSSPRAWPGTAVRVSSP